jgi:hypothetical protein
MSAGKHYQSNPFTSYFHNNFNIIGWVSQQSLWQDDPETFMWKVHFWQAGSCPIPAAPGKAA